jgi:hypothetical protein
MAFYFERQIPVFPAFSSQPEWRGLMLNTHFAHSPPGTAEYGARGARYLAVLRFTNYVSDERSGNPFILLSEFCFLRTSAPKYGTPFDGKLAGHPWFGRVPNRSANIDGWPHGS